MHQLFKALNDPTRRQILEMLRMHSLTAGQIADACQVGKPTVSHHLDLLRQAELVEEERRGQFRVYHLNTSVVEDVVMWLRSLMEPAAQSQAKKTASLQKTPQPKPTP